MSRAVQLSFLLCAGTLLSGCIATQRDILEVEQQTDELKTRVSELKGTLKALQENQADLTVKIDQLHSDIATFNETMKDSQDRMDKVSAKMDDLQSALGQKVSALGDTLSKQHAETQAEIAAAQAAAKKAEDRSNALTPTQLLRSAKNHLRKKNYDLAIDGFQTYIKRFPKGASVDWAGYYLGEAYLAKKSYEEAARQYATVLDRWPKSQATPSSRLKYALCLIKLNKNISEAKKYLESIPEDFPKSPEANQAIKLLKSLTPSK